MKPPAGLSTAGRALWGHLAESYGPLTPTGERLVTEVARCSDRLDRLDIAVRGLGAAWMTFRRAPEGTVTVTIDRLLAEQRAQALVLRALLTELRQSHGTGVPLGLPVVVDPGPVEAAEHDQVTDIRARIAARQQGTGAL